MRLGREPFRAARHTARFAAPYVGILPAHTPSTLPQAVSRPEPSGVSASKSRHEAADLRGRRVLLYLVERYQVVVVVGHTGCGKTTQIPQYLHQAGWTAGGRVVACTQPRRVAVTSVAQRVAEEMGEVVGGVVGYAVRFDERFDHQRTRVKYLTDGMLLRELLSDPLLSRCSALMIDGRTSAA